MKFQSLQILTISLCFLHITVGEEKKKPITLQQLVPRIDQESFQLVPSGQKYELKIWVPVGNTRIEYAELRGTESSGQEIYVKGDIDTYFDRGHLWTVYEAGKNGYIAKYKYVQQSPFEFQHVSALALKSAAG